MEQVLTYTRRIRSESVRRSEDRGSEQVSPYRMREKGARVTQVICTGNLFVGLFVGFT